MNLPKVFEEKMKDLLGSEYEAYTACYDEPRHYGLRVNTAEDFCGRFPEDRTLAVRAGSVDPLMDSIMTEIIFSRRNIHIILQDFIICRSQVP